MQDATKHHGGEQPPAARRAGSGAGGAEGGGQARVARRAGVRRPQRGGRGSGAGGAGSEAVEEGVDGEAESLVAGTGDELGRMGYEEREARRWKAGEGVTDPEDVVVDGVSGGLADVGLGRRRGHDQHQDVDGPSGVLGGDAACEQDPEQTLRSGEGVLGGRWLAGEDRSQPGMGLQRARETRA